MNFPDKETVDKVDPNKILKFHHLCITEFVNCKDLNFKHTNENEYYQNKIKKYEIYRRSTQEENLVFDYILKTFSIIFK